MGEGGEGVIPVWDPGLQQVQYLSYLRFFRYPKYLRAHKMPCLLMTFVIGIFKYGSDALSLTDGD